MCLRFALHNGGEVIAWAFVWVTQAPASHSHRDTALIGIERSNASSVKRRASRYAAQTTAPSGTHLARQTPKPTVWPVRRHIGLRI